MAVALMACGEKIYIPKDDPPQKVGAPMTFNVTASETNAVKGSWADGDKIFVFFNALETKYLVLERRGGSWISKSGGGTLMDSDFSGLGTKKLTAVHFPVSVDVAYADGKFSFASGGKPVYNYYLFEKDKEYTVSGTTVTATLSMGRPADLAQIRVADIQGKVSDYTFGCSKIKPVACASVGTDGVITESVLQDGARLSGVAGADGGIFAGRLTKPGEPADYVFTLASDTHIYTLTRSDNTLTADAVLNFPAPTMTGGANWEVRNASDLYVDLGVEVGGKKIYWTKCNLGSNTETGYGDFFSWGELTSDNGGKTNFGSGNYLWSGTPSFTILSPENDAAYAAFGGKFRMPTKAEIDALLALTKKWVTNYKGSGANGYEFTGNGNTLFLPAAGYRYNESLLTAGTYGYYWSSSINTGYESYAWNINLGSGVIKCDDHSRYLGYSVRPVSE